MSARPSPVFRFLVRLYPRPFRDRYGEELLATLEDVWRDRRHGRPALALRLALDVLAGALREHGVAVLAATPRWQALGTGVLVLGLAALAARQPLADATALALEGQQRTAGRAAAQHQADAIAARAEAATDAARAGMLWVLAAQASMTEASRQARSDQAVAALQRVFATPAPTATGLWTVAAACDAVQRSDCPRRAALHALARIEPDNAAVWHAQLEDALPAATSEFPFRPLPETAVTAEARHALARMADARYYRTAVHGRLGDVVADADPNAATDLAQWRLPFAYGQFWAGLDRLCRHAAGTSLHEDCRRAAARLAEADGPVAQAAGAKLAYALSASADERSRWRDAYRRALWVEHALAGGDSARWRAAASETDAAIAQLRAQGQDAEPPTAWARNAVAATLAP